MTDHTTTPTTTHEHPPGSPLPELLRRVADELHTAIADGLTVPDQINVMHTVCGARLHLSFEPMTADQARAWTARVGATAVQSPPGSPVTVTGASGGVLGGTAVSLSEYGSRPGLGDFGPRVPAPVGTRQLADRTRHAVRTAADCVATAAARGLAHHDEVAVFPLSADAGRVFLSPIHGGRDQLRGWAEVIGGERGDHRITDEYHSVLLYGRVGPVAVMVTTCGTEDPGLPAQWTLADLPTPTTATVVVPDVVEDQADEDLGDEDWAAAEPDAVWLTADAVVLARCAGVWSVLLVRRRWDPFAGRWALPGGHVEAGETVEAATVRELAEETGLTVTEAELRTVGTFHAPGRDPRGRYVTVASAVVLLRDQARGLPRVTAADDAAEAAWLPLLDMLTDRAPELGFDHAQILTAAADLVCGPRTTTDTGTTGGVR